LTPPRDAVDYLGLAWAEHRLVHAPENAVGFYVEANDSRYVTRARRATDRANARSSDHSFLIDDLPE
jgi:hypothetical protein